MEEKVPQTREEWFAALGLGVRSDGDRPIERFMRPYRDGDGVHITEEGGTWFEVTGAQIPEGMMLEEFSALLEAPIKSKFNKHIDRTLRAANLAMLEKRETNLTELNEAIIRARQYKD